VDIGALCNNASMSRNEDGVYVGQSTDVALLNVLTVFGMVDRREVGFLFHVFHAGVTDFYSFIVVRKTGREIIQF
jgi:hypothetical protein